MIRLLGAILCLAIVLPAHAQRTDPNQYQARIAQEVQPFLSDCTKEFSDQAGDVYDPTAVQFCKAYQANFAVEYLDALEGNMFNKFDVGLMFLRGDQTGVKYNETMACAWWTEMTQVSTSGTINDLQMPFMAVCQQLSLGSDEALSLAAEEAKISNLTY